MLIMVIGLILLIKKLGLKKTLALNWETFLSFQVDQKIGKKCPMFLKVAKTVANRPKMPKLYTEAQIECPKYLNKNNFETLKYLQQTMFWNDLFRWKCKSLLTEKVAQNVAISLGYFVFSKNNNELPKVA